MPARLRHSWHDIVVVAVLGLIALILAWSGVVSNAKADTPIPDNPGTYVVDQTGILSPADKQRVEQRLARYERSRPDKPQFVVLIVKDLPDQGMEQFATEVFRKWGVGQKGADNGALEVIHPKAGNHADVRLELGRGIEGAIPDMSASDINRKVLGPLWVKGQYADGIIAIADKLAASLDPVSSAQAASPQDTYYREVSRQQGSSFGGLLMGLILFVGGIGILFLLLRRERRSTRRTPDGSKNVRVKTSPDPYPYQDDNYRIAQEEKLRRQTEEAERARQRIEESRAARRAEQDRIDAERRRSAESLGARIVPPPQRRTGSSAASTIAAGAAGVAAGMAAEEIMNRRRREREREEEENERRRRRDRDDTSSYGGALSGGSSGYSGGSSSYDSGSSGSSSGSSDSGYSGGGGDSGGGGSSDSF